MCLLSLNCRLSIWIRMCHISLGSSNRISGWVWKPSDWQHSCTSHFIFCLLLRDADSLISEISGGRGTATFRDLGQSLSFQGWLPPQDLMDSDHHKKKTKKTVFSPPFSPAAPLPMVRRYLSLSLCDLPVARMNDERTDARIKEPLGGLLKSHCLSYSHLAE